MFVVGLERDFKYKSYWLVIMEFFWCWFLFDLIWLLVLIVVDNIGGVKVVFCGVGNVFMCVCGGVYEGIYWSEGE